MRKKLDKRQVCDDMDGLFDRFYAAKVAEGRSNITLENYRRFYNFFADYLDKNNIERNINVVDVDLMRDYISWLLHEKVKFDGHKFKKDEHKQKGLAPRTVNNYIKAIKIFFNFLYEEGIIPKNPIASLKKVKQPVEEINVLTAEELRALLKEPNQRRYADFRDYTILNVMLDTMCRINELLLLKKSDVDFKTKAIHIRAEIAKNRRSRYIPLSNKTSRLIAELNNDTSVFDSEYIFLTNYGERLKPNHFRKRLQNFAERAGIAKRVYPHLIRHTAATMFLENGGDSRYLQLILGHSDIRMVEVYTHLSKRSLAEQHKKHSAINVIDSKLSKERKILR